MRKDVPVTGLSDQLLALAQAYGVATDYWDWRGNHVSVPEETIVGVLAAMDVDASTPEAAARALAAEAGASWRRTLPPCVVTEQGAGTSFPVHVPHGTPVEVWVELESGGTRAGLAQVDNWEQPRDVDGTLVGEASFRLPDDLPLGYHTIHARAGARTASCALVVTPRWLGLPERMGEGPSWGLAAQLYSVRSRQSWGVGDLTDLTDLAVWSGSELGADYLLVNPLHAGEPLAPMEPSPYLPASRRFFNPLYLRVERIPEYADLSARDRAAVQELLAGLRREVDGTDVIDRNASWTAKRSALKLVHGVSRTAGREADLRAFRSREGESLTGFATWSALAEVHGNDFRAWPEPLRHPATAEVAAFAREHADVVEFHLWLQWVVDEQLQLAQAKAVAAGMRLGVMHDLAVGVHPGGADVWRLQDVYAAGMQVGAPPDAYNQIGQDWGQPPWRPDRLQEVGYAPFRELIGGLLRYAGGVRVDHIIGLFRLWWVPAAATPREGTYVRYDHTALIGILALEAHRAGAVVVGEDLGVVEPSARDYLKAHGILGTSILWFEKGEDGKPLPAERWRELCLASVTTHDLPPSAGYLAGDHVRLRDELGLLTRPVAEEMTTDEAERAAWLAEVSDRGLLPASAAAGTDDIEATVRALHEYLTLTPARLLSVALVDAVGDRRTQNQPGTSNEYPNWRVPLSGPDGRLLMLEDVMGSARAASLADVVRRRAD